MEPWKKNLAVICFVQTLGASAITFIMSFIPLYVVHLGVTDLHQSSVWSGLIMSCAAFFAFFSGPLWGNLGDRYGRKLMVQRVLLSNSIVTLAMGFAGNIWILLLLRSVQGALGGFHSAIISLVTSVTPQTRTAFALGLAQGAMTTGSTLGPMIGGFFADHWGFRSAFLFMGALSFLGFILTRKYVQENFEPQTKKEQASLLRSLSYLVGLKPLMALVAANFLVQFTNMVIAVITPFFVRHLGAAEPYLATLSGAVIAAGSLTGAIAAVVVGRLADRFEGKFLLIGMALGSAVTFMATAWVETPMQLMALRALNGFFLGGVSPTVNALIHRMIPKDKTSTAFGVTTSFYLLGNVLGPLIGGSLVAPLGFVGIFHLASMLMASAALWVFFVIGRARQTPMGDVR